MRLSMKPKCKSHHIAGSTKHWGSCTATRPLLMQSVPAKEMHPAPQQLGPVSLATLPKDTKTSRSFSQTPEEHFYLTAYSINIQWLLQPWKQLLPSFCLEDDPKAKKAARRPEQSNAVTCTELLRVFHVTAGKNTKNAHNEKSEEVVLRVHLHLINHQRIKRPSLL